jgi:hypothetical protein
LGQRREYAPSINTKTKRLPTAGRGLPVFLSGLDNREEHHKLMIEHLIRHSSINIMVDHLSLK